MYILEFFIPVPQKLLDWIDPKKLDWVTLSMNPEAIDLLKANPEKISWTKLSQNPAAIDLLKANPEKIDWNLLSRNPSAIELLRANPEKINICCNKAPSRESKENKLE